MRFTVLFLLVFSLFSCSDKDQKPTDQLQNGTWKAAMKDGNPSSNPTGSSSVVYYAWDLCQQDDIYTFKNGKRYIDKGVVSCGIAEQASEVNYQYNPQNQKLVIGETSFDVAELNENRLKYYVKTPGPGGSSFLIFIFEKK